MQAFRFGPAGRQLAGILHPPTRTRSAPASVLICNPFGQEAIRIHRLLRLLAENLARKGFATLRFDYFGTGDSDGDDEQASLSGWRADIGAAHAELARATLARKTAWLGVRLGGTAALQAAEGVAWPPAHLIAWEPVLDGAAYLSTLRAEHADYVRRHRLLAGPAPGAASDLLGFAASAVMAEEIGRLGVDTLPGRPPCGVTVVGAGERDAARWPPSWNVNSRPLDVELNWTSEEALNTALAPMAAIGTLAAAIEEALA